MMSTRVPVNRPNRFCVVAAVLLLSLLWSGPALVGYAAEIDASAWEAGKGAALKNKALTVDVPDAAETGNLLEKLKSPLKLEPGVYRLSAVLSPEPLQNMGYEIVLTVKTGNATVIEKSARAFQHDASQQIVLSATFALTQAQDVQAAIGWRAGEYHKHETDSRANPASLDRLALSKLSYEKLPQGALLGELKADKVVYKPGMAPVLQAPLTWTGREARELKLQVRQTKDLGEPKVVATATVSAEPCSTKTVSVTLPAIAEEGGYRFDLEVLDGARVLDSRERSAAVSSRYNRIGMFGIHKGPPIQAGFYNDPTAGITAARDGYLSWIEEGFWAPDDFQGLTPKEEHWLSGVNCWLQKSTHLQRMGEAGQKCGIGVFAYIRGYVATGREGYRWAQKHPDLLLYHAETGRPLGGYEIEKLVKYPELLEKGVKGEPVPGYWGSYVVLNTARPMVVDLSAQATIDSIKMFGWAGIRFDGDFILLPSGKNIDGPGLTLNGKEPATDDDFDYCWAANLQRYRKKVKSALPTFEMGCNTGFADNKHIKMYNTLAAIAADGGMLMNEEIRGHVGAGSPYNPWKAFAEVIAHDSRKVRSWGGYYQCIGSFGMRPDDYLYQSVYTLAAQAKGYGPYYFNTDFSVRLVRFITRFSGILCADQYPVAAPDSRISVTGSGELEWKNYVNFTESSPGRRDYVMHLINPPTPERANSDDARSLLREPVKDVVIDMELDGNETVTRAWLLDPWNPDDFKPVKVTPRMKGATLELPDAVTIWNVVVIECAPAKPGWGDMF